MARYRRQTSLFSSENFSTEHGGSLRQGRRKTRRPIALKRPMHVVVRSTQAVAEKSFLVKKNYDYIRSLIPRLAHQYEVNIYERAINGNHIHLASLAKTRVGFQSFLRVLTSKIAHFVTGTKKGKRLLKPFFDEIPYTRIAEWGRAFAALRTYIQKNILEAFGMIPYTVRKPRKKRRIPP